MDKVVVTGATSLIGRQTIPFLKNQGFDIYALTSRDTKQGLRDDISWHLIDLFDYRRVSDFCNEIKAANLLHLAWYDNPKDRMISPKNIKWVEASINLVREFTENGGKKIVFASSCAEYDWQFGYCREDITPTKPESLYGECKSSLNKILEKYSRKKGIHYSCGKIFFVYGPHEHEDRLMAYIIRSLLMNQKAELKNGNLMRDYLHANDVANALTTLLKSDIEGSVNIGSGRPVKLSEIADLIGQKLNKIHLVQYPEEEIKTNFPVVFADINKLRDEVGWIPKFDLGSGIDDTIEWWKDNHKKEKLNK